MLKDYVFGDLCGLLRRLDRVSGWWAQGVQHADTRAIHACYTHRHVFGDGVAAGKRTS